MGKNFLINKEMARIKKKPRRSVGGFECGSTSKGNSGENSANPSCKFKSDDDDHNNGNIEDTPYFVDVDRSSWGSIEHKDLSEIVVNNLNFSSEFSGFDLTEEICVRIRLCNVNEHVSRMKLGHWPVIASENIYLEFLNKREIDGNKGFDVVVSGQFDGSDEGVTGLVHLVSLKYLTLRPVFGDRLSEGVSSVRIRAEMLQSALDACESVVSSRPVWKKSMMSVMVWLRPEVTTSEARYGVDMSSELELSFYSDVDHSSYECSKFDIGRFYEAIKRSKDCAMLDVELPDLLPELRPYQRRAAHWMVQREKSASEDSAEETLYSSPLNVAVDFLDSHSKMFYNPFSGNVSMREEIPPYVFGGILADEMGLGKTVELLACVFAHRKPSSEHGSCSRDISDGTEMEKTRPKRLKRERVECICGALSESSKYEGLWVQCDVCDSWQHADCVGYLPPEDISRTTVASKGQHNKSKRKKSAADIVIVNGEYVCPICSELMQATSSPIESGATLIICPAPILPQWHAEILRHTNPGSLKVFIYEGVKEVSLSKFSAMDINELVSADIVLTTYDVLREDLSHDSERHEGDRRLLRYQKRYHVVPTHLTRVLWWRICLDEAQMVETSVAAAAEMALRLHARFRWCITGTPIQRKLDDLFGLLRFLKASPFDVSRWWAEVIREPYEKKDATAMTFTHNLFRQLMWRSSKSHVADELELPLQEEHISWLSFSAVEEHFYQRQHETCVNFAREVLHQIKSDIHERDCLGSFSSVSDPSTIHLEAEKLMNSLLKLRQACCHPQVGGSGLRSIQRSPMTMEEVLSVLIGKTKLEGEEALRKVISSLNGLAGIAILQGELLKAASLYKEALALAEENSEDFRVDPLLNLHIHHNLAEVLKSASNSSQQVSVCGGQLNRNPEEKPSDIIGVIGCLDRIEKGQIGTGEDNSERAEDTDKHSEVNSNSSTNGSKGGIKCNIEPHAPHVSSVESLIDITEGIKRKYLSGFYAKLSQAQQEFQKSYMQVCDSLSDEEIKNSVWWLEALHQIEQKKEVVHELSKRIENAVLERTKSPIIASGFRNMTALKFYIQNGLDLLDASRKKVLDQLLNIDQTMENPNVEDIERVRYCSICDDSNTVGRLCVHCELDKLFQAYEGRLFLRRAKNGNVISSSVEVADLRKNTLENNQFYSKQKQNSNSPLSTSSADVVGKGKMGKMYMDSRVSSDLEIILGVIRSYFKPDLGEEGVSAANRHLSLFEIMKKEYTQARSLAIAQAQILRAHDETKMAMSRLRLRDNDDDNSIDALSLEELDSANVINTSDKFVSLDSLSRIRGKLRYLQGLVISKNKIESDKEEAQESAVENANKLTAVNEDICPICQEVLQSQKMVFQCGHLICCNCLFKITDRKVGQNGKLQSKWLVCPTCRQRSDYESIAFADDNHNRSSVGQSENLEASVFVQGSYGTKIEAITRRILWIKSSDPEAKVLVFSSWNDVLDVLEHAFAANEISYVRMKGGRKNSQAAITCFKEDNVTDQGIAKIKDQENPESKFIQVLLLLTQHGANGLNLLEAKHVILVEPLLNPAAEAQAISRVHRIGQTHKTHVHRFLVKDTVEESIYGMNRNKNTNSFVRNKKNRDQLILTVKDVESLFAVKPKPSPPSAPDSNNEQNGDLIHLPPSAAAAIAAERRLGQC